MNTNLKVLIADDSELMRMIVKGFFKKLLPSSTITEASNLVDTFTLIEKEKFDFLMLDINMSDGDSSPDTVKKVLAIQPNIKVCMFTGNDKTTFEKLYIEAGAFGFIQKDENMGVSLGEILKRALN
ncbi:DNA-binding response regulator [Pedobacter chinensis]|uniref:DNA-binding response regulator n=1 Tax=Pedobacter chinensis TaxID=2282421 RepID=A0A369Q6S7_9SPHI|nr:response regulator [Pedobacter chinensis]RDC58619.1 DNA-binding response regulator [Pedobacter chinensis]